MSNRVDITGMRRSHARLARRAFPSRRTLLAVALIALAVVASFTLAGCKYSDVLTEHIEDPTAEIDESQEPIYQSNPDAEERPDLANLSVDESDDQDTQVAMLPHYDPDAPDNGPTKQLVKSTETPHDQEASEGQKDGEADREGTGEGDNGGENTNMNNGESEGEKEGDGDTLNDGDSDEKVDSTTGGANGNSVITDPDGTTTEPDKGTVAAIGEYATMTQMLAGGGGLVATSQAWLDDCKAKGLFASEGDALDRVQVGFNSDGSCKVDALVNTIKPAVILWDSTANQPAISDSDRAQLEAAGISIQSVPHIGEQYTEDYDVQAALAEVANVLSGASSVTWDPSDTLSKYITYHNQALTACYEGAPTGYSYKATDASYKYLYQDTPLSGLNDSTTERAITVYVDDLLSPSVKSSTVSQQGADRTLAHHNTTVDLSDGVGLSATTGSDSFALIDYYLQLAGVMNDAYDGDKPNAENKRYILAPGIISTFSTSDKYAKRSTSSAFFFNAGDGSVASNWHALGESDFNTVLVANKDIQKAFVNSAKKSNGLYRMEGQYRVIIVPTGAAGSWAQGHVDSFIMAPWTIWMIRGYSSAEVKNSAAGWAKNFYATFFRCDNWEGAVADWDSSQAAG